MAQRISRAEDDEHEPFGSALDALLSVPEIVQPPRVQFRAARLTYHVMALLLGTGAVGLSVAAWLLSMAGELPLSLVTTAVAGIAWVGTALLIREGRKHGQPTLGQVLARDRRPPVILFRPFVLDDAPQGGLSTVFLQSLGGTPGLFFTLEEWLKPVVEQLGPFVAVGAPVDAVAQLGAARVYAGEDRWKAIVQLLMSHASAAIVVTCDFAASDWTYWEFQTARRMLAPSRVFVVDVPKEDWCQERELGSMKVLPEMLTYETLTSARPAVIRFDEAGVPHIVRRRPYREQVYMHPLLDMLYVAFLESGLSARRPSVWHRPVVAHGCAVALVLGVWAVIIAIAWLV